MLQTEVVLVSHAVVFSGSLTLAKEVLMLQTEDVLLDSPTPADKVLMPAEESSALIKETLITETEVFGVSPTPTNEVSTPVTEEVFKMDGEVPSLSLLDDAEQTDVVSSTVTPVFCTRILKLFCVMEGDWAFFGVEHACSVRTASLLVFFTFLKE